MSNNITYNNELWWLKVPAGLVGVYDTIERAEEAELKYLAEKDDYKTKVWNDAIIASLKAISITRQSGPYLHDVIDLLRHKTHEETKAIVIDIFGYDV